MEACCQGGDEADVAIRGITFGLGRRSLHPSRKLRLARTEVNTPEDYEAFRKAGYAGAHWGTIATWPAEKPHLTIDNVFVRGLKISEVRVVNDPRLSDHALLRCRLSFED